MQGCVIVQFLSTFSCIGYVDRHELGLFRLVCDGTIALRHMRRIAAGRLAVVGLCHLVRTGLGAGLMGMTGTAQGWDTGNRGAESPHERRASIGG